MIPFVPYTPEAAAAIQFEIMAATTDIGGEISDDIEWQWYMCSR